VRVRTCVYMVFRNSPVDQKTPILLALTRETYNTVQGTKARSESSVGVANAAVVCKKPSRTIGRSAIIESILAD